MSTLARQPCLRAACARGNVEFHVRTWNANVKLHVRAHVHIVDVRTWSSMCGVPSLTFTRGVLRVNVKLRVRTYMWTWLMCAREVSRSHVKF